VPQQGNVLKTDVDPVPAEGFTEFLGGRADRGGDFPGVVGGNGTGG
jgi:hypothetical protein